MTELVLDIILKNSLEIICSFDDLFLNKPWRAFRSLLFNPKILPWIVAMLSLLQF